MDLTAALLAVVHSHAGSVLPLRIFFGFCLFLVLLSGLVVFRKRHQLFDQDPQVVADHWAARSLRLGQVVIIWVLAIELFVTALWRL